MKKELLKKTTKITRNLMESLWHDQAEEFLLYLDDYVFILGPFSDEFYQDKSSAYQVLKKISQQMSPDGIINLEIYPVSHDTRSCTVLVHFIAKKLHEHKHMRYVEQSVTIIWHLDGDGQLKINHIHYSIPRSHLSETADLSNMNYIDHEDDNALLLSVKVDQRHLRMISSSSIEYAQAKGHSTLIYMSYETVCAHMDWKNFLLEIKRDRRFMQVHRSYVVRCDAVKMIGKNYLEMNTGREVPVSAKNMKNVLEKLTGRSGTEQK